ncbi:hypothetical protein MXB_4656, partial [Myxobolus squamalis]
MVLILYYLFFLSGVSGNPRLLDGGAYYHSWQNGRTKGENIFSPMNYERSLISRTSGLDFSAQFKEFMRWNKYVEFVKMFSKPTVDMNVNPNYLE